MKQKIKFILIFIFIHIGVTAQNYVVTSIAFEGIQKNNASFLKNLIQTKEGGVFKNEVLNQDITRLIRLPAIANATYKLGKNKNNYTIVFKIVENITTIPSANVFLTSNEELAYSFGVFEHNLFRRSISLGGFYRKNVFDSFGISLNAPYLFSPKLGIALSYNNLSTQEPVFFPSGTALYKYNNASAEAILQYQFNFKHKINIGINFFKESYTATEESLNIPEAPDSYSLDKTLFKGIYTYDNLIYNYQYISGIKSQFFLQYVISPGENTNAQNSNDFIIGWNDLLYYKRIKKKGNWATRLRVGLSTNDETPFAPFSVDNNLNLRGVGNIIDRGTGVIVINTEYRYTLLEKDKYAIQSNLFVDAGTWRNPGGDFNNFTDTNNVRVFPGAGMRFIHKKIFNLVLRIDYGFGVTPDEPNGVVFGVGQYF